MRQEFKLTTIGGTRSTQMDPTSMGPAENSPEQDGAFSMQKVPSSIRRPNCTDLYRRRTGRSSGRFCMWLNAHHAELL